MNSNIENSIVNFVVLYNNENEVLQYAKKLELQKNKITLVVCVNKIKEDKKKSFVLETKKINLNIIVYFLNNNVGYLNGMLYGCKLYLQNNIIPDWSIFSNTDIEFDSNNYFERFLKKEYIDDIWIIGPAIYSSSVNSYQNPHYIKRQTKISINKRIFIFNNLPLAYLYQKLSKLKLIILKKYKLKSCFVYSVHGSFFFLKKDLIEILLKNKFTPILYGEELYIAEIVLQNNKKCYYDADIEIIHEGSTTTNKINFNNKSELIVKALRFIKLNFYNKN